jgi:hypothetical protein
MIKGGQFTQLVKFAIGNYIEIQRTPRTHIRISATGVTRYAGQYEEVDAVILDVSTGGGLVYGGGCTKKMSTNCFAVPTKRYNYEEEYSVYFFHVYDEHTTFFRCLVDHLNIVASEVTLNVHYLEVRHPNPSK